MWVPWGNFKVSFKIFSAVFDSEFLFLYLASRLQIK